MSCCICDSDSSILHRAGIQPYYGMQGRQLPDLWDKDASGRDEVLIEDDRERIYLNFDRPQRIRTMVTARYRMTVFRPMQYGELFDLWEDPDENVNLWNDPAVSEIQQELAKRMLNLLIDNQDWTPAMTGRA